MGKIGEQLIKESRSLFVGALRYYQNDLNAAYLKAENALDVGIKLSFVPDQEGIKPELTINFVAERKKQKFTGRPIDEDQLSLFVEGRADKGPARTPADRRGPVGNPAFYLYGGIGSKIKARRHMRDGKKTACGVDIKGIVDVALKWERVTCPDCLSLKLAG